MAHSYSMKTRGVKKMARQVKTGADLDRRNKHKIVDGNGHMTILRNILGLNHRVAEYSSGVIKTSVQGSQLNHGLTTVRDAEVLLRKALMLQ